VAKISSHIKELGPILESTYQLVREDAPNASIYVVGYPNIFPSNPSALCTLKTLILPYGMRYLASFQNELSNTVSNAASMADVTYVNPNKATGVGSFAGHSVCSSSHLSVVPPSRTRPFLSIRTMQARTRWRSTSEPPSRRRRRRLSPGEDSRMPTRTTR